MEAGGVIQAAQAAGNRNGAFLPDVAGSFGVTGETRGVAQQWRLAASQQRIGRRAAAGLGLQHQPLVNDLAWVSLHREVQSRRRSERLPRRFGAGWVAVSVGIGFARLVAALFGGAFLGLVLLQLGLQALLQLGPDVRIHPGLARVVGGIVEHQQADRDHHQ